MTAEALKPITGIDTQAARPSVAGTSDMVEKNQSGIVVPFRSKSISQEPTITQIRLSTELLKDVIAHTNGRPNRQQAPDDLTRVQYIQGLLDACAMYGEAKIFTEADNRRVIANLTHSYSGKSESLAHTARTLLENVSAKKAEITRKTQGLNSEQQLIVIGEAAKVQKKVIKKTGITLSEYEGYDLPQDKVKQAKQKQILSAAGNIASTVVSLAVGYATKDYNFFDFQNKAASIATAIITYVPLVGSLIYYGKENLKQLKEKGINLVYWSKKRHERSILKGKSQAEQEKAANSGYYEQEGGIEAVVAALSVANESFTMWGMSNLVSTAIIGGKIVLSRCYRLGPKEGLVQPVIDLKDKVKNKLKKNNGNVNK